MWKRIVAIFKSILNALISKAEDPALLLEQTLTDMRAQHVKVKQDVAKSIADEKRLKKQLVAQRAEAADWEAKAMFAVEKGDDELAKQALTRHGEAATIAEQFETAHTKQAEAVGALKAALKNMAEKIGEAERKKGILLARNSSAKALKGMEETRAAMTDGSAFDTFDRMEAKVDRIEAEADAATEMAEEHTGDDLKRKFEALEAGGVDDALAALKAKMARADGLPTPVGVRVEVVAPKALPADTTELEDELAAPARRGMTVGN